MLYIVVCRLARNSAVAMEAGTKHMKGTNDDFCCELIITYKYK